MKNLETKEITNVLDNLDKDRILQGQFNCFVTGMTGSGKTELMKQLIKDLKNSLNILIFSSNEPEYSLELSDYYIWDEITRYNAEKIYEKIRLEKLNGIINFKSKEVSELFFNKWLKDRYKYKSLHLFIFDTYNKNLFDENQINKLIQYKGSKRESVFLLSDRIYQIPSKLLSECPGGILGKSIDKKDMFISSNRKPEQLNTYEFIFNIWNVKNQEFDIQKVKLKLNSR